MKRHFVTAVLLCACNAESGVGLEAAHHDGYFAAVSTNYMGATSISLLGSDGKVVDSEWVSSKTANPDLRTPLSDDVVLPTVSFSRRYLTTIERGLGVISRFDLDDGKVLGQVRTDSSPDGDMAAYHSNPQDVFYVDEQSAWVSRWAPNLDASAPASEQGTDLVEWNPTSMKRTSHRIDLSSLNATIDEQQYDDQGNPTTMAPATAYARPASLVPAGAYLAVGLVRATGSFSYAGGLLAIVDPIARKLMGTVELKGASNCGTVYPVRGDADSVLVACIGSYGDGGAASGIFEVHVDGQGKGKVAESYRVADHAGAANVATPLVSLGDHVVVAVAAGTLDPMTKAVMEPDAAYRVDLHTGKQSLLVKSTGAFALGIPAFDADSGILLLPDAGSDEAPEYGVQRFKVSSANEMTANGFVKVAPSGMLPVREIHSL